jgi:hypothetical protein
LSKDIRTLKIFWVVLPKKYAQSRTHVSFEKDGNRIEVDEVQPAIPCIHPSTDDALASMLPTPSEQPIVTRPPMHAPHGKGAPQHHTRLQIAKPTTK